MARPNPLRISGCVPCWIRVSLVRVGYKYYLPDSVVPPERQQEALYEYLKKEGFACRKDITTALQIETEQCSALLKHEVDSGNLIKVGQKYYLKES